MAISSDGGRPESAKPVVQSQALKDVAAQAVTGNSQATTQQPPKPNSSAVRDAAAAVSSAVSHIENNDTTHDERETNYNADKRRDSARFGEGSTAAALQRKNQQRGLLVDQHKVAVEQARDEVSPVLKPLPVSSHAHSLDLQKLKAASGHNYDAPQQGEGLSQG